MACVYILTNPAIPGLLKIGFTGGTAVDRAAQISQGTGVPSPYLVQWFMETTSAESAYEVEQDVHKALANDRHVRTREFFTTPLAMAIDTIERIAYQKGVVQNNLELIGRLWAEECAVTLRETTEQAQREATERAQREATERAQREATERAQREATERAQREAAEHKAKCHLIFREKLLSMLSRLDKKTSGFGKFRSDRAILNDMYLEDTSVLIFEKGKSIYEAVSHDFAPFLFTDVPTYRAHLERLLNKYSE
jgi:hypothetical protein